VAKQGVEAKPWAGARVGRCRLATVAVSGFLASARGALFGA